MYSISCCNRILIYFILSILASTADEISDFSDILKDDEPDEARASNNFKRTSSDGKYHLLFTFKC